MAKLVFQMSQSLDGYVDHLEMQPGPALFRHFVERVRGLTGGVYGRRVYEIMRYWDEDDPEWSADRREFARKRLRRGRPLRKPAETASGYPPATSGANQTLTPG